MSKKRRINRRDFIKGAALTGAGLTLGGGLLYGRRALAELLTGGQAVMDRAIRDHKQGLASDQDTQATVEAYMTSSGSPHDSRVVHVHDPDATNWDFGDDYYGNDVDQGVVNAMVARGIRALTGTSTVAQAWRAIIPNYTPGQGIAIKVNFNNWNYCDRCQTNCEAWTLKTDALIHPVNGIIQGLKQAYPSLQHSDVWVYDATVGSDPSVSERQIPNNVFADPCRSLYPGVRFFDQGCQEEAEYTSSAPSANITWRNPGGTPTPPSRKVTDVLVDATYLINMPILKKHGGTEVTLSFKNHAGSISNFAPFHDYVYYGGSHYSSNYNPLVDIYLNPHIQDKTVLILADGLFGNWYRNETKSQPWLTFGNQAANSLLFAVDPVAIDCVMCDLLDSENVAQSGQGPLRDMADDYLVLAAAEGLGTYERGDPWGSGYSQIDYERIEL